MSPPADDTIIDPENEQSLERKSGTSARLNRSHSFTDERSDPCAGNTNAFNVFDALDSKDS